MSARSVTCSELFDGGLSRKWACAMCMCALCSTRAGHRVADSGPGSVLQEQCVCFEPRAHWAGRRHNTRFVCSLCTCSRATIWATCWATRGGGVCWWSWSAVAGRTRSCRRAGRRARLQHVPHGVDLTEAGLANAERVVELAFRYLAMLREAGPRREVHDELRDLSDLRFRFKDKENPVSYAKHSPLRSTYDTFSLLSLSPARQFPSHHSTRAPPLM